MAKNRYIALLTDEGLDMFMPIANKPEEAAKKMKDLESMDIYRYAQIDYTFQTDSRPTEREMEKYIKNEYKPRRQKEITSEYGSADMGSYLAYSLRKQSLGNVNEVVVYMTKKEFQNTRLSDQYEGAIYIIEKVLQGDGELIGRTDVDDLQDLKDMYELKVKQKARRSKK